MSLTLRMLSSVIAGCSSSHPIGSQHLSHEFFFSRFQRNMYTEKTSFPHWAANYLAFYIVCAHMCTCTHTLALTKTHHDSCGSPKTTSGSWFSPSTCLSWDLIELSSLGLVVDTISPLPLFPRPSGQLLVILLLNIFIMLQYHYHCAPEIPETLEIFPVQWLQKQDYVKFLCPCNVGDYVFCHCSSQMSLWVKFIMLSKE